MSDINKDLNESARFLTEAAALLVNAACCIDKHPELESTASEIKQTIGDITCAAVTMVKQANIK